MGVNNLSFRPDWEEVCSTWCALGEPQARECSWKVVQDGECERGKMSCWLLDNSYFQHHGFSSQVSVETVPGT